MACIAARPVVERLAAQYDGQVRFIRLNAYSAAGRDLAADYQLRTTPTFVFLDASGNELGRSLGVLTEADVQALVE